MPARSLPTLIGALLVAAGLGPIACSGAASTAAPPSVPAPPTGTGDAIWMAQLQRTLDSAVRAVPLRGASAAVVLADGRIWRGVAGFSVPGVPLDTAMRLGIGSITKSITATLLVRLAEQGRLSLDDSVGRWLPRIPHVDPAITVRQLLNHSSGVFDVTNAPGYRDSILADVNARWTPQRMLGLLRPPLFPRGTGWSYSNTNYQLAGLVAEAAGGRPLHQLVRETLLNPIGVTTPFLDQYEAPTGPLPGGWSGGTVNVMDVRASTYSAAWAAGAYFATPEALARWWQGLMTGQLVGPASLSAMMTTVGPEGYGLGIVRRQLVGRPVWSHTGEIRGFSSVAAFDTARRFTVVLIANENPAPVTLIAGALVSVAATVASP
ncbi:MAG: serine hydrolase domain-containing protein [Gemmatimonas sp.]|jgi:D-alanyl-D-alanine carboxypeptidase|uniref:serine hydrolase domain-containing protein n=1 Tax=Gemmatimonas sp. TaxID=1962908 RepID=UPI0022C00AF1|nr:serine hydrolase domain-containing protein [Gemmatimonas sp.]MCA2984133.1 beta-lactamase family protein [Gemmatimonas sp.]MCA2995181.1 beta-lactamase family protein [Gemmatimonas sp.]MCZ8010825.1 serine hydrolase [Gemmatimonas sp.]MCZ8266355.1 serine hydrolase [Gemmatimonas sp.]